MTSCVFSLFFLLFLCSSITADGPTGLKVRITNKAPDILKDYGLKYLRELVNRPFEDIPWIKCVIKSLTLTHLDVDRDNVDVRFQEGSGLQFEFRNLSFTAEIKREINLCFFKIWQGTTVLTGDGVDVTIGVRLIRNQGRLSLEIPPGDSGCKVQAERVHLKGLLNAVGLFKFLFTTPFCPAIRRFAVPTVKTMLADLAMTFSTKHSINLDYSLSGNVMVTKNSLDVPFTGVVYYGNHSDHGNHDDHGHHDDHSHHGDHGDTSPAVEPVFTDKDNNQMAYVGVSEDLFKSAGQALYDHEPFELTVPQVNFFINFFLKKLGLPKGPVKVQLTEEPAIKINKEGISVNVTAITQSQSVNPPKNLSVECQFKLNVDVKGSRLILQYLMLSKCEAKSETLAGRFVAAMAKLVMKIPPLKSKIKGKITSYIQNWFNKEGGIQIPLPNGLDLTQTQIDYYDGYFVVGGDLTFTGK